jgi:hypothetical protein
MRVNVHVSKRRRGERTSGLPTVGPPGPELLMA